MSREKYSLGKRVLEPGDCCGCCGRGIHLQIISCSFAGQGKVKFSVRLKMRSQKLIFFGIPEWSLWPDNNKSTKEGTCPGRSHHCHSVTKPLPPLLALLEQGMFYIPAQKCFISQDVPTSKCNPCGFPSAISRG